MPPSRISVFDMFKIGVGPSSSHTLGPWRAARHSLACLEQENLLASVRRVSCRLYGSLAYTGRGHRTDAAIIFGLSGLDPTTVDTVSLADRLETVTRAKSIALNGGSSIPFDHDADIEYDTGTAVATHPNTFDITYRLSRGRRLSHRYVSPGGGAFHRHGEAVRDFDRPEPPHPCQTAGELLRRCRATGRSIPELVLENERFWQSAATVDARLRKIWETMKQCVLEGVSERGILPGGLGVRRRAPILASKLAAREGPFGEELLDRLSTERPGPETVSLWTSTFALAVNEVNAAMGRVVTSPTNGAAGVVPAVLLYAWCFEGKNHFEHVRDMLCTAGELGSLYVKGATVSAAQGGCQAEVGVSASMAAGGLAQIMGGSPEQVAAAAEMAMEHHLGLTCDPVGGLVQIPCIERNAFGASTAILAARLALAGDPAVSRVSLDDVIATMWSTARDMNDKYKETSRGGLAVSVKVPDC
ncbi:MAG: L-serine ammonia-lyase [Lentisphaeria bacterium]|nr:L-serine ammonia-lyase [Lentisphaeria bacterium]